jgi:hypothetical protein
MGDPRTVDEIKADGDEMSVQARYSGGAPGAVPGEVLSDSTGYSGGTYAQNREAHTSGDGDSPEDYIAGGYLDEDEYLAGFDPPRTPEEQHSAAIEAADQAYRESVAESLNEGIDEAAQAYGVPTEALQERTLAHLDAATQEAMAMGTSPERIQQNFLERPQWFLRQAALEAAQEMNQNAVTNVALPYLDSAASRAARR